MTEVLKKCRSVVDLFGKGILKNNDDKSKSRLRTTSETGEVINKEFSLNRRVTFADLEDLHSQFGGARPKTKNKDINGNVYSNIGYINKSYYNEKTGFYIDKTDEDEYPESVVGHVVCLQQDEAENRRALNCNFFEMTFGKRGKDIGEFQDATDITYLSRDCVMVTDMINGRIQICNRSGETSAIYSGDEISEPWATCVTSEGHFAITSRKQKCVSIVSKDGDVLWSFGAGFFECPCGVSTNSDGNFIVTDACTNRVSMHEKSGKFFKYIGNSKIEEQQFLKPRYVCVSRRDDIIVSDSGHHCLKVFDKNGHYVRSIGKFGKQDGCLKTPYGVCTDSLCHILVADHYNNRISMFTRDGAFVCHVIDERHGVKHPKGLSLTSDLNLYISNGDLKAYEIKVYKLKCSDPTKIVYV